MASDNRLLSQFNLEGIPPAPRGVPQIEVKFDIDANGILSVSAKDLGTGVEQTVKVEQSSGLSEDEIKAKLREAEQNAETDKKKKQLVEARNEAESRAYQLEKLIKQQGDKLKESDKSALEAAIAKVREAAKGDDPARIKSAVAELEAASHAMSEALYKATAGAGADGGAQDGASANGASGATSGQSADDDAIDAEFEVKS
jgi:molecular chaperone DnaK